MIKELNIYIDFHKQPFTIDISDFETGIHAIYVCSNENDIRSSLPLALDYYKKLHNNYKQNIINHFTNGKQSKTNAPSATNKR